MSQKTSFKPFLRTISAVEIQVFTGTITSEPFLTLSASSAISSASVPLPTLMQ